VFQYFHQFNISGSLIIPERVQQSLNIASVGKSWTFHKFLRVAHPWQRLARKFLAFFQESQNSSHRWQSLILIMSSSIIQARSCYPNPQNFWLAILSLEQESSLSQASSQGYGRISAIQSSKLFLFAQPFKNYSCVLKDFSCVLKILRFGNANNFQIAIFQVCKKSQPQNFGRSSADLLMLSAITPQPSDVRKLASLAKFLNFSCGSLRAYSGKFSIFRIFINFQHFDQACLPLRANPAMNPAMTARWVPQNSQCFQVLGYVCSHTYSSQGYFILSFFWPIERVIRESSFGALVNSVSLVHQMPANYEPLAFWSVFPLALGSCLATFGTNQFSLSFSENTSKDSLGPKISSRDLGGNFLISCLLFFQDLKILSKSSIF